MSDVYVMGVDMIKFGRFPEKTVPQLGATAALMALDDAGLKIQDMQALYCGNLGQASGMVGQRVLQEIGQTGMAVVNTANACATGATAFREAWMSIKPVYLIVYSLWALSRWVVACWAVLVAALEFQKKDCWALVRCRQFLQKRAWSMRGTTAQRSNSSLKFRLRIIIIPR